ncbi:MAG: hypothetical protein QM784_38205 [Polyangiaceae bacterium]
MKAIVSTVLGLLTLSVASVAAAEVVSVPAACLNNNLTQRAYSSGKAAGKSLVQRAWQSVNDCGRLDYFSDIVRSNVESYLLQGASAYSICRYSGMLDGVYEELDEVWISCGGLCCIEGQVIGALAAGVYCQLSQLLGGLDVPADFIPRPVCTCEGFSSCCAGTFTDLTQDKCREYTAQPYYDVWRQSRSLQCNE